MHVHCFLRWTGCLLSEDVTTSAWERLEGWDYILSPHSTLLEDRPSEFSVRPVTPSVGAVLPPVGSV